MPFFKRFTLEQYVVLNHFYCTSKYSFTFCVNQINIWVMIILINTKRSMDQYFTGYFKKWNIFSVCLCIHAFRHGFFQIVNAIWYRHMSSPISLCQLQHVCVCFDLFCLMLAFHSFNIQHNDRWSTKGQINGKTK